MCSIYSFTLCTSFALCTSLLNIIYVLQYSMNSIYSPVLHILHALYVLPELHELYLQGLILLGDIYTNIIKDLDKAEEAYKK